MIQTSYDLMVVGGGPAGVTAALRACELGARVALVEKHNLGGTCTNDGCVPTRVLAKAARLVRDAHQWADYGIEPYQPQVDFQQVLRRAQHIVYQIHEKKQLLDTLENAGVTVFAGAGSASFVDPHTLALNSNGIHLQAKKFILAVGGRARCLNFPGAEHALTHSDVWAMRRLPASVAIVGGAATGCQLASILADFGARVHLLEASSRLLGREDELLSQTVGKAFEQRGIQIQTHIESLERIEKSAGGLTVVYCRDGREQRLLVETVILAVGWPGNVEELNLPAAGVRSDRGYILVDDQYRTSASHIYAAGDITGRMMLVQSAGYEARAAAENALIEAGQSPAHQVVPHGGFTDPEYGSVGLTEAEARQNGPAAVAVVSFAEMDRAVIDGRPEGFCKLITSLSGDKLLGAHVVGEQALEIVHLVAAGMASGMRLEQLAALEIAYPTFTAVVGLAARRLASELGLMRFSPQWRAFGKPLLAEWERADAQSGE